MVTLFSACNKSINDNGIFFFPFYVTISSLYPFQQHRLFASDFSICMVRHANAAQPFPFDKQFPHFLFQLFLCIFLGANIDTASASICSGKIAVFFYDLTFFYFPVIRNWIMLTKTLIHNNTFCCSFKICFYKICLRQYSSNTA